MMDGLFWFPQSTAKRPGRKIKTCDEKHKKKFSSFLLPIKSESVSGKMSLLCVHVEILVRDINLGT
jgi:hypothetical protein